MADPSPRRLGDGTVLNDSLASSLMLQSEFLAIGSMVVFSIYLQQRGSPESKPVGAAHVVTDKQG